ncbi:MAG: amidohydrolase family protein [Candidatus Wallbacteria bacterium]|nr:amidohydrolase family protein [Candidatus Wallbacteria bacterium]
MIGMRTGGWRPALAVLLALPGLCGLVPLDAAPPPAPNLAALREAALREAAGPAPVSTPVAIVGGTVITVTRGIIPNGTVLIRDGKIAAVGHALPPPAGALVIDATGKYVMPGLIDTHSHLGVYPWPNARAHDDGNEMTEPLTPHMRAEDGLFLEDPGMDRVRAGGVTTVQIIPGSANLQGGQAVILKLRLGNTLDDLKFKDAPRGIKMAFGENPKRVYGSKGQAPMTRMGNSAVMRQAFTRAREYQKQWAEFEANSRAGRPTVRPEKDAKMETLIDVLEGRVRVHVHCYRKDDLLAMIRIADEFGFKIASFQHCLEGYKIAHELAKRDIGAATWPDWWGFKMEAWDAIPQNASLLAAAGVRVSLHSDSANVAQRLFGEAGKAVRYGMRPDQAIKAITWWPATILGIESRVGSLEAGKDADIAIFTKHPFDVYSTVEKTLIDGQVVWDAAAKEKP